MRIPTHKIYRAFPELDRFSDEECERMMVRANRGVRGFVHQGMGCALGLAAMVLSGVAWLVVSSLVAGFVLRGLGMPTENGLVLGAVILGVTVLPAFCGLWVYDVFRRRALLAEIRTQIDRVRCFGCDYILIGQVARDGAVTCPECGQHVTLDRLGITEDDLIPPPRGDLA